MARAWPSTCVPPELWDFANFRQHTCSRARARAGERTHATYEFTLALGPRNKTARLGQISPRTREMVTLTRALSSLRSRPHMHAQTADLLRADAQAMRRVLSLAR